MGWVCALSFAPVPGFVLPFPARGWWLLEWGGGRGEQGGWMVCANGFEFQANLRAAERGRGRERDMRGWRASERGRGAERRFQELRPSVDPTCFC